MHKSKLKVWPSRPHHLPTGGGAVHRTATDYRTPSTPTSTRHLAGWLQGASVQVVNAFQWRCQPHWRVPLRIIGDNMWFYIRTGHARCRLGEESRWRPLRPGDLFLIPQGRPHAIEADGSVVECDSLHFFFRGRGGVDLLQVWRAGGIHRAHSADFARLNRTIAAEFAVRAPGWQQAMSAATWEVLLDLARHRLHIPTLAPDLQRHWDRLAPVLALIEERLDDAALTVAELADAVHVSEPYLRKLVKQTLNSGVIAFIQRRRLERASHLLIETNLVLKEITARSGFASPTLFHRLFRRRFGVTPAAYRERGALPYH
ncbi:MAG: AraC family transcriptional regulator [Verrucomicrobia bacterium]|nr:AraC family transcriptional regulator [Verrucomicrobiota bacterium]